MKKTVGLMLILTLLLTSYIPVFSVEIEDLQNEKSSVDSSIDALKRQQATKQSELSKESSNRKYLESVQIKEASQFESFMKEVKSYDEAINKINDDIKVSEDKYNKQAELFKTRLKAMYESSTTSYLQIILESKSIVDLIERMKFISSVAKSDKELVAAMDSVKKDMEYKKKLKEDEKQAAQNKAIDKQIAIKSIQVSRSDVDSKISRINTELNKLAAQEDSLLKKSKELESVVKSLQRTGGKYTGGDMVWPAAGQVTSPFGMRMHPILRVYRMHTGVDINAANATSIFAANKGTVILAGWQSDYGNTVIIDHGGGISTLYAHCSRILVGTGAEVDAGDIIAKVGSTGLATGPHLHFEVRINGIPTNPLEYVNP